MVQDLLSDAMQLVEKIEETVDNAQTLIRGVLTDRNIDSKHRTALNMALNFLDQINDG